MREFRRGFEGLKGKRKERKKKGGECKKLGVSIAAAAAPRAQRREQVGAPVTQHSVVTELAAA